MSESAVALMYWIISMDQAPDFDHKAYCASCALDWARYIIAGNKSFDW